MKVEISNKLFEIINPHLEQKVIIFYLKHFDTLEECVNLMTFSFLFHGRIFKTISRDIFLIFEVRTTNTILNGYAQSH